MEVDGIPDRISVKMIDGENTYYLPEDRSAENYAISVAWSVADVKHRAKERGLAAVTTEQDVFILDQMEKRHDTETGISWSTIDFWLDEILEP